MEAKTRQQDRIPGPEPDRAGLWMYLFLALLTAFRLYYAQTVPLSEDEGYYWDWSRRLDWGYFDQGPMVAWLIRCGTLLFGHTELGVRFAPIMLSLGMSLFLYDFMRRFWKDPVMAFWSVTAMNLSLLFSVGAVLMTYDTPQAFFWTMGLYFIARAIFEERRLLWYPAGLAVGAAILAKYSAGMLPVLTLAFLAFNKEKRHWLASKEPWLASLLAGLILLPNIWWNAGHLWVSFGNTLRHAGGGEINFTTFEFIGAEMGLIGPIFSGFLVWGLWRAWGMAKKGDALMAFLLWTSLPVLFIFTLLSTQSRMQPNWPAMGYLSAIPAGTAAIWPLIKSRKKLRGWAAAGLITSLVALVVVMYPSYLVTAIGKPERNNPWAKLYGWDQLTPLFQEAMDNWPGDKPPVIISTRFQLGGSTAFYAPGQPRVYCIYPAGTDRMDQYAFWSDPAKLKGKDAILITLGFNNRLKEYFERVEKFRSTKLRGPWDGPLHHVTVYYCFKFLGKDHRPPEFRQIFQRHPAP